MISILIPLLAATNDVVATAAADPASSPSSSGGIPWTGTGIAAVVVAAAVVLLRKYIKWAPSAEKLDGDELVNDVLAAVAKDMPNHEELRAELVTVLSGTAKPTSQALADILRIEESYEKLTSGKYRRRVSILKRKDGSATGTLSKVESEVSWEYIPDAIRARFIETRESKVVRRVYDAGKDVVS